MSVGKICKKQKKTWTFYRPQLHWTNLTNWACIICHTYSRPYNANTYGKLTMLYFWQYKTFRSQVITYLVNLVLNWDVLVSLHWHFTSFGQFLLNQIVFLCVSCTDPQHVLHGWKAVGQADLLKQCMNMYAMYVKSLWCHTPSHCSLY